MRLSWITKWVLNRSSGEVGELGVHLGLGGHGVGLVVDDHELAVGGGGDLEVGQLGEGVVGDGDDAAAGIAAIMTICGP